MNVLLISRCSKNAREQSCQILDQFAERKGNSAWQTSITLEGLNTLRRLLRKTARRNTAVACHWIKKSGQTELVWIVGNLKRFNAQGTVPTHRTSRDILRNHHEARWPATEAIALLASIAGLFHDFGKASALFQDGLTGQKTKHRYQPFRHEWISVRLFQAFIAEQTDREWLTTLGSLSAKDESLWLERIQKDTQLWSCSPFTTLPPLAQFVAWLILSHHRLPEYLGKNIPDLSGSETWLTNQLNVTWNALNHISSDWREEDFQRAWTFPAGLPLRSHTWQDKARQLAKRAANAVSLGLFGKMDQVLTLHMARLVLMLADHHYSSQDPVAAWQDADYSAWANTHRQTGHLKQKLDEHIAGVSHHALLLGRSLPLLRCQLPAITRHKGFRERAKDERYRWQNKAWDVSESLSERARKQGFFGINMASTGCGKTFANARIMYALAGEDEGCRFTVALGLRTLTLQTGEALRRRLGLGEDDLAVIVGSRAVRELHQEAQEPEPDESSASEEAFFESHQYVHYDGVPNNGPLRHWLEKDTTLHQLVDAPVLVTTIDHLIPATEGVRGGKQIAPMLRLLTSDLVLDEPDDFDIADQHALCRLVNWAGMLGSRVLLSSATLPPAFVLALHTAYCSGRKAWQQACGEPGMPLEVCCAWFDEDIAQEKVCTTAEDFYYAQCAFAESRAKRLAKKNVLRISDIVNVTTSSSQSSEVISGLANTLHAEILKLHKVHQQPAEKGKTVSSGLVRMANINPLVATAQALMRIPSPDGYCIHYCVYHSQHPLAVRSFIEKQLDLAFTRDATKPHQLHPSIQQAIHEHPAQHHIFVVLGTSVIEVGRDWDADWGIIEPSSMRSLIQFAGRIQRHRQIAPSNANMLILNKNVRALSSVNADSLAYCRPGFETQDFMLSSHDMQEMLQVEQYRFINSVPRIVATTFRHAKGARYDNLSTLEHGRSAEELLGKKRTHPVAADWWRAKVTWSGELQRRTPFRRSQPEAQFFLMMEDEFDEPRFMARDDGAKGWKNPGLFIRQPTDMAEGVRAWINTDYAAVLMALADAFDLDLTQVCERFGEINLRASKDKDVKDWLWHPLLGVFRALN